MEPKPNPKLWALVTLSVAALGCIGTIVAALIGVIPDLLKAKPTAIPATVTPKATSPATLAVTPTTIAATATSAVGVTTAPPAGYTVYDDFLGSFETHWWLDNPGELCKLDPNPGLLGFTCTNNSNTTEQVAALHPITPGSPVHGVAALVSLQQANGRLDLTTRWKCAANASERSYHLSISRDSVEATEFYPTEGWRGVLLGTKALSPSQPHWLQIEHHGDEVQFVLDGKRIALSTAPNLEACLEIQDWGIDLLPWKDGNTLAGQIEKIAIRP